MKHMPTLPGSNTVMASCTACLSRLSRANIQWGFTFCCFNTFFTYGQKVLYEYKEAYSQL